MNADRIKAMGLWVAVAALLFGAAEIGARQWKYPLRSWYPGALRALEDPALKYLFVGTSRIAAAIDAEIFAASIAKERPEPAIRALNLGQGNSTSIEHTLGLRSLADAGRLSGRTVFVEAAEGMPDTRTWEEDWYFLVQPELLLTVLRFGDLPRLWASDMDRRQKISISGRYVLSRSRLVTYSERLRSSLLVLSHRMAIRLAAGAEDSPQPLDLAAGGDVRTDALDLPRIRLLAVENGRKAVAEARIVDWDALVIAELVRVVQEGGGRVVFVEIPVSSAEEALYRTSAGRENRWRFLEAAERWQTPLLAVGTRYADEDFPDLWHLAHSRAQQFTRELASGWLALQAPGKLP